jgi:hypothetical protein
MEPEFAADAGLDADAVRVPGEPTERARAIRAVLLGAALGVTLAVLGRRRRG